MAEGEVSRSFVWHCSQEKGREGKWKLDMGGSPQLLDAGAQGQVLKHLTLAQVMCLSKQTCQSCSGLCVQRSA